MAKSAAKMAAELSEKKSANKAEAEAEVEAETMGGIDDPMPEAEAKPAGFTGTPFDLVEGKPNVDFFGPLEGYQFVQTNFGEYAIPQGKILRFEAREEWDAKQGRPIVRQYPVYEDAPAELLAYVGIG